MTIVSPMGQLRPVFADKNDKRLSGGDSGANRRSQFC